MGWLGAAQLLATVETLDGLYDQLDLIDTDAPLVRRAGELAQRHSLRGYDAIHLAAAERIAGPTTVLVAGDRDLCAAARARHRGRRYLPRGSRRLTRTTLGGAFRERVRLDRPAGAIELVVPVTTPLRFFDPEAGAGSPHS
ncbi:MAG: type II toxin-antitoxin system VapC family toxin [Dehalococcoidia bacterium]